VSEDTPVVGLRERKRYAAMRLVQEVALDLFDAHGYADVTVERIAAASDISPSSVYRYFGTKEYVVLWDEYDPIWSARIPQGLRSHPPLETLRFMVDALVSGVLRSDQERLRRRISLIMREPSVEAASALQAYRAAEAFGTAVSEALDREHGDLEIQLFSHALVGAVVGGLHHWYEGAFSTPLETIMRRAAASFERGFGLAD
jgi:AcrR family transcriptional regulator